MSAVVGADRRWRTGLIACPRCGAPLPLPAGAPLHIDSCGFESCSLECWDCRAAFAGIIDPYDDALLLSAQGADGKTLTRENAREIVDMADNALD